ncbi:MAG: TetR/AcrR family transcriptional regulator [Clostridiales bacterium]|nr:TetR/AcrR family transcriptional regulator [Clostridiales bacterium]
MAVTKSEIVASFRRHIEDVGLRTTSVEDIARELHISKKTVYVHFKSKDDIFRHVLQEMAVEEKTRITGALDGLGTCAEKIEGLIGIIFRTTRDWWREHKTSEFAERFEIGERVFLSAYTELISEWVESGVKSGEFHVSGSTAMTVTFIGGIILAGTRLLQHDTEVEPEIEVVAVVRKLLA